MRIARGLLCSSALLFLAFLSTPSPGQTLATVYDFCAEQNCTDGSCLTPVRSNPGSTRTDAVPYAVAGPSAAAHGLDLKCLRRFHHIEHGCRHDYEWLPRRVRRRIDAADSGHLRVLRAVARSGSVRLSWQAVQAT
jgi:hypothetical protein